MQMDHGYHLYLSSYETVPSCFFYCWAGGEFNAFQVYFNSAPAVVGPTVLGDLTAMQTVVKDTQAIAEKGDLVAGGKRTTDFETLWDAEESRLRPMNKEAWSNVDSASDGVVKALRSKTPDAAKVKSALAALLAALSDPSKPVN